MKQIEKLIFGLIALTVILKICHYRNKVLNEKEKLEYVLNKELNIKLLDLLKECEKEEVDCFSKEPDHVLNKLNDFLKEYGRTKLFIKIFIKII